MTVKEFSREFRISLTSAYAALRRGDVPCIEIGNRKLISRDVVESMLKGEGLR